MSQSEKASLSDVINYTPETYFSDEEIAAIRGSFNGPQGAKLLKIVRKAMVPTISDPDLPVEEMGKDMFMSAVDFRQMQEPEVKPTILGLQLAMKIVLGGIIQLKQIANIKEESQQEKELRMGKNSSK